MFVVKSCDRCGLWTVDHPSRIMIQQCGSLEAAIARAAMLNGRG